MTKSFIWVVLDLEGIAVFGLNSGYKSAEELGVSLMVAQDEYLAGELAATRFLTEMGTQPVTKAVFVNHEQGDVGLQDRFDGFKDGITRENPNAIVKEVFIDVAATEEEAAKELEAEIGSCTSDVVMNGGNMASIYTLEAIEDLETKCTGVNGTKTALIGTLDTSEEIYTAISSDDLLFAISQQPHLQAVLPVMFATQYVTTGMLPAKPIGDDYGTFLSGPHIVDANDFPSTAMQKCADEGFPDHFCLDRPKIRVGGVLHGVTSDEFWDPVFAASEQAANDMNVQLDLERFTASESDEALHQEMSTRIKTLCDSMVDGLFVSIPSSTVVDAVEYCLNLNIPVIGVNSGVEFADKLGLMHYVGQLEVAGGYQAGKQSIAEGITQGWCANHEPDNVVVHERCEGMEMAFNEVAEVEYMGQIELPHDDDKEYVSIVEAAIGVTGSWDGLGLLLAGQPNAEAGAALFDDHPEVAMGIFDVSENIFASLNQGKFIFAIDQQPYLQGYLPVPLLVYNAYAKQHLANEYIQTGPALVFDSPTANEITCEANNYKVCPLSGSGSSNESSDGGNEIPDLGNDIPTDAELREEDRNEGLIIGLTIGGLLLAGAVVAIVALFTRDKESRVSAIDPAMSTIPKDCIPDVDIEASQNVPADSSGAMMA
ncbi:MAG: hypothetical protein SGILL_001238 [Bacillariaceae sp.]